MGSDGEPYNFMSILQDLIPDTQMGQTLSGYGGMGIWNAAWLEKVIHGKKENSVVQYSKLKKEEKKTVHFT
jgi:hypothetical protein